MAGASIGADVPGRGSQEVTPMAEIVLYIQPAFQVPGHRVCFSGTPFAIKVARVLQYKRLPFRVEEVGWLERSERLPALSQSGKLPIVEYDGRRIEDSTTIAHFLEERHPEPRLVPADAYARARMHVMEDWSDEALYFQGLYANLRLGGRTTISFLIDRLPDDVANHFEAMLVAYLDQMLHHQGVGRYPPDKVTADLARSLDALEAIVARDGFAAGPALTLADVALFAQIERYFASGTHPGLEREIDSRRALVDWFQRVDAATAP
jgi:glutathione S-transferase